MAIWQFDIYLIPRSKVREKYGKLPSSIKAEDFFEIDWWGGIVLPDDVKSGQLIVFRKISEPMSPVESWSGEPLMVIE